MKSPRLRLLLVVVATVLVFVQGYLSVSPVGIGRRTHRDATLSSSCSQGGTSSNSNTTSLTNSRVFTNPNYVSSPTRVVPMRVIGSRRPKKSRLATLENGPNGQPWLEMARNLAAAAATTTKSGSDMTTTSRLLREAATSIHDMGVAWTRGDWEAFTYAAFDASQRVDLVALSLQNHNKDNSLQRAVAGIAVELHEISSWHQDQRHLQGIATRLEQACHNAGDNTWAQHFQQAHQAVGSLDNQLQVNKSYQADKSPVTG